jgi:hypothetical protein
LSKVEFSHNNMMYSTTQQTSFFANHGLHLRFDIQGIDNVMDPTVEDQITSLANIQAQLISNLEKVRR